jgi:hypothetical protein
MPQLRRAAGLRRGRKLTVQCPFCSNVVIVPEELRPAKDAATPTPVQAESDHPVPNNPDEIKARIRENRHAEREKRRELRHQLRKIRRQGG